MSYLVPAMFFIGLAFGYLATKADNAAMQMQLNHCMSYHEYLKGMEK